MNSRWMNTNVSTAAEMLEVTDDMILDISNGEVLYPAPCDDDDPCQDSMTDPMIFGELDNDDALMGHIHLPYPVVNIQYLFGDKAYPATASGYVTMRFGISRLLFFLRRNKSRRLKCCI